MNSLSFTNMSVTDSDPDCLFCKIIAGTIPCQKILETDKSFAFMDIFPTSKGISDNGSSFHYASCTILSVASYEYDSSGIKLTVAPYVQDMRW